MNMFRLAVRLSEKWKVRKRLVSSVARSGCFGFDGGCGQLLLESRWISSTKIGSNAILRENKSAI